MQNSADIPADNRGTTKVGMDVAFNMADRSEFLYDGE